MNTFDVLSDFFGLLIPSDGSMPSASEIITAADLDNIFAMTHKYAEPIENVSEFINKELTSVSQEGAVAIGDGDRIEMLRAIESTMPHDFSMLVEVTYLLYYSKPKVHELIKWDTDELAEKNQLRPFDSAILETISRREPFWRQA